MKLRCLIVDDEPPAQEIMKTYVQDCPQLELVHICGDAFAAGEMLQSEKIDLLLLDINLPRLSGLSFLKSLSHPPLVIFTTAYPEYAVEGFETGAVDYLVKPFSFDRFLKSVNKAVEMARIRRREENPSPESAQKFILLRADKKSFKVNFSEILWVEATGDYLKVFLDGKHLVIHETIKGFHDQLPAGEFIRVHKSYLVSVNRIIYIEGNLIRIGDKLIPIGRSYKEVVERRLTHR
jgi:DNA-binding LytR/AlgR family response regulator